MENSGCFEMPPLGVRVKIFPLLLAVFCAISLFTSVNAETIETDKGAAPNIGGPMQGDIGGPFTLVDHNGNTVTDTDFRGRYMLIYFGYTYCPDVCPTAAIVMARALEQLGEEEKKVVPIIITIDPERDRPEDLKEYVAHFHPRMVGLSGTPEQVAVAVKAYKVYAAKIFEEGWGVDEYFVYHSDVTYFMGPDGKYIDHFGSGTTPKIMAERMRKHLKARP